MDTPQAARTEPDITILIPVYKTGALLPRALDNLLAQPHSNIEIVAVNDASPDDAARILADYAARDPRLRIVTHPENRGTLAARLSGIAAARGRYIMCLDADDSLEPETFDRLWKVVRKESPDIIDFGARLIAGASRPTTRVVPMGRFHGDAVFEKVFVEHFYSWSLCFKLIRADLCRRAAACVPPEYCIVAEDFYFYSVIAFFARSYRAVPQMYYNYYTGIGVSDNFRMDLPGFRRFLSIFTALSGIRSFLVSQGAFDRYGAAFRVREAEHFDYLFERWECRLKRSLQPEGYRMMCASYDRETVERQLKRYFSGREQQLEFALSGQSLPEYGTATGGGRVAAPFLICPGGPGLAECWGNWSILLEELLDRLPELRPRCRMDGKTAAVEAVFQKVRLQPPAPGDLPPTGAGGSRSGQLPGASAVPGHLRRTGAVSEGGRSRRLLLLLRPARAGRPDRAPRRPERTSESGHRSVAEREPIPGAGASRSPGRSSARRAPAIRSSRFPPSGDSRGRRPLFRAEKKFPDVHFPGKPPVVPGRPAEISVQSH